MNRLFLFLPALILMSGGGPQSQAWASESPYAETLAVLDSGGIQYQLVDGEYEWQSMQPMFDFLSPFSACPSRKRDPSPFPRS